MVLRPQDIADMLDHSLLKPELSNEDIIEGCETARKYNCISVCCRPADVPLCVETLRGSRTRVTTVIGFPHGSNKTEVKVFEAEQACRDGAVELDLVLNIGRLISGDLKFVEDDIRAVCETASGFKAEVKVIFENCYLTDAQKRSACEISERAGADYVKTSTGFGVPGDGRLYGSVLSDLRLMRASCSPAVRVKAAGGIRTLDDLLLAREAGAVRIGVTATAAIMEEAEKRALEGRL